MTDEFLQFSRQRGNDLSTPLPEFGFPGLKAGDRWCLCAPRWQEALEAEQAPHVILRATHEGALEYYSLDDLKRFAIDFITAQRGLMLARSKAGHDTLEPTGMSQAYEYKTEFEQACRCFHETLLFEVKSTIFTIRGSCVLSQTKRFPSIRSVWPDAPKKLPLPQYSCFRGRFRISRERNHKPKGNKMAIGTVKFFNSSKGFGFISPEGGGKDVFVHVSAVEAAGMRTLSEGQKVNFDIQPDARGSKAANLSAA